MSLLKGFIRRVLPQSALVALKKWYYVRDLRTTRVESEPDLAIVSAIVQPGDSVIDVGANIGLYSRCLSELVGSTGQVFSLEPIPTTYEILKHVAHRLGLTNVKAIELAASDRCGEVIMEIPPYADGGANPHQARVVSQPATDNAPQYRIRTTTLDDLINPDQRISFIKIDVEGHEWACLLGLAFAPAPHACWWRNSRRFTRSTEHSSDG